MTGFGKRLITWLVGLSVAGGGLTFCLKLYDFIKTASQGDLPGFAFATVVSYFIVTVGFLCLALWAFLRGHYDDIEEPKYRLLRTEEEIDRRESEDPSPPSPGVA